MPGNGCVVPGCSNRSNKVHCQGIAFYSFPKDNPELLREWLIKTHLCQKEIKENSRICGVHFVNGRRNGKHDVPQIFPWSTHRRSHTNRQPPPLQALAPKRVYVPLARRREIVAHDHCYCESLTSASTQNDTHEGSALLSAPSAHIGEVKLSCDASVNTMAIHSHTGDLQPSFPSTSTCTQTDSTCLSASPFCIELIADNTGLVHFYTGFDNYDTLMICYNFLGPCVHHLSYWGKGRRLAEDSRGAPRLLSPMNEFFLVLCRLRLGLLEQDLALRFGISQPTVSRICITWINLMYSKFREVTIWPTRDHVNATMPSCFTDYPTTRVVIDATEIFIEQPSSPMAQQLTFSSYKNHNTFKALIGITPSGAISFVSTKS